MVQVVNHIWNAADHYLAENSGRRSDSLGHRTSMNCYWKSIWPWWMKFSTTGAIKESRQRWRIQAIDHCSHCCCCWFLECLERHGNHHNGCQLIAAETVGTSSFTQAYDKGELCHHVVKCLASFIHIIDSTYHHELFYLACWNLAELGFSVSDPTEFHHWAILSPLRFISSSLQHSSNSKSLETMLKLGLSMDAKIVCFSYLV